MKTALYKAISCQMQDYDVPYETHHHLPVFTSDAASQVMNHPTEQGTKCLVFEFKGGIAVVTLRGDERADLAKLKQILGTKRLSLCSADRLETELGTHVGGVAPFGYGANVRLIVSASLFSQATVYFNAGTNDVTIGMAGSDFERIMLDKRALTF